MKKRMNFTFNGRHCSIVYDKISKEFSVVVYKDSVVVYKDKELTHVERSVGLFHVDRFSESQLMTAYHVANRHVLHNWIS